MEPGAAALLGPTGCTGRVGDADGPAHRDDRYCGRAGSAGAAPGLVEPVIDLRCREGGDGMGRTDTQTGIRCGDRRGVDICSVPSGCLSGGAGAVGVQERRNLEELERYGRDKSIVDGEGYSGLGDYVSTVG